ncbi:MAG TPA: M4 family metallopeptidase [Chloroflexia bacterium]
MPAGFRNVSYSAAEGTLNDGLENNEVATFRSSAPFEDDETAARFFLGQVLGLSQLESIRSLTAPADPRVVPELRLQSVRESPLTSTRTVFFEQTQARIPVFGSQVVVELDQGRSLMGVDAELAELEEILPIAKLSPSQALGKIARLAGVAKKKLQAVQAPLLTYFYNERAGTWHLAYFFQQVPATPKGYLEEVVGDDYRGHGLSNFPRLALIEMNYLVDAHDGKVLFFYSANPMLDVPVKCQGIDEEGQTREFWGRPTEAGFEMYDPLRNIRTYDLGLHDFQATPLPSGPVSNSMSDWADTNRAAVSAHINAMRVLDFFKGELKRDGIDGKGMELISIVNVTSPADETPPAWNNAVWWQNRMWYGQAADGGGQLRSYSRFLDVIAHELTHGVTKYTSNLVYKDQPGALNESFSDIFGVIIKNWYLGGPDSARGTWNWELGEGLRGDGLPLRDLSDPNRTRDPSHMRDYIQTVSDNGGVHTNSNIHNKAAYNVLTASDQNGQPVFPVREVAILYYLTLTRLPAVADFAKVRQSLIEVANIFYLGDRSERERKVAAIRRAYTAVGIN